MFVKEYLSFRPPVLVKRTPVFIPAVNVFFPSTYLHKILRLKRSVYFDIYFLLPALLNIFNNKVDEWKQILEEQH